MMSVVFWLTAAYLAIGLALAFAGPLRKKRQIEVLSAAASNPALPGWKLTCFNFAVVVGTVLLWPLFLGSLVGDKGSQTLKELGTPSKELRFQYLGGVGRILCLRCGYFKTIISFEHGHDKPWCRTGYQCQACGEFTAVENSTADTINKGCQCGGTLSTQQSLFCPACKSKHLDYRMEYIT